MTLYKYIINNNFALQHETETTAYQDEKVAGD